MILSATLLAWLAAAATPARLIGGGLPEPVGPDVVGGGEVLLEVTLSAGGRVTQVVTLRQTPPYTERLAAAVRGWRFTPARDDRDAVESHVLVAGVFRPPTVIGAAGGEPPKDVARPSEAIPFPTQIVPPAYPPNALYGDAHVLVELDVDESGGVGRPKVVQPFGGPFDSSAADAASQWRFKPAPRGGHAFVYVVFGFRQPVVGPAPGPTPPPGP